MKVLESFILNEKDTVMVCPLFDNEKITSTIKIGDELITDFELEESKGCFSEPKTRNIFIYKRLDNNPEEFEFV